MVKPKRSEEKFDIDKQLKVLTSEDYVQFADTFNHETTQKLISESISKLILQEITCNHETRTVLKKLIKEVEKEELLLYVKKFGIAIWMCISMAFGSVITIILKKFLK
ncbi:MAG: hypothetical protein LBQ13_04345 [Endomicrobium sp.]|jgi:hypothetical protein|nr:hypothetical protein [Endomicrobium sp.]